MKISTKFLLTIAASALMIPMVAADCDNTGEGEGEGEEGEGEEGEGEEGEGEGEDVCDLTGFDDAAGDGLYAITADWNFEEADSVICDGLAAPNLVFINVLTDGGNFAADIGNTDVEISINGVTSGCTNSPTSQDLGDGTALVLCPLCVDGQEAPADLGVQVTDNDGSVSDAVCVLEAQ